MTNYRSPGTESRMRYSIYKRRAAGDLLAPDGKISVIIDRKDPLAAQGALTVSAGRNHRRRRQDQGGGPVGRQILHLDESGVDRAGRRGGAQARASRPWPRARPGMRPLDAVRAGYDEVTHINFIMMQAMPQEVVDKANTAARLEGPAKYGKDVDLDSPAMKAFYAELSKRNTIVDPTLTVWEPLMTSDGSTISPEYAPFADIAPPAVARGWKISGYPLFDGLTREDFRKSFDKMVGLVGRLHKAGVRIVAGTDGYGLELVRELELYQQAGLTQRRSAPDRDDRPRADDRNGRPHRIDRQRQDGGHDPGRRRRFEGPPQPAPRRDRVPRRLPARRRGAARGERPQRNAEVIAAFRGSSLNRD